MLYDHKQIALLMSNYFSGQTFSCERLTGGGNNVLWRAQSDAASKFVIKDYGPDGKERLDREWAFLTKLAKNKVAHVSMPIWIDRTRQLACFSYLGGTKLRPQDVTKSYALQAAQFINRLSCVTTTGLRYAKGSHFTLKGHLDEIEARVKDLEISIEMYSKTSALNSFIEGCVRPEWDRRKTLIKHIGRNDYFSSITALASPSDFGFHNILSDEGALNFIDFEYAGIDDLAKLLADFSLMPAIPVTERNDHLFREAIFSDTELDKYFHKRLALLDYMFPIKWVCIILNVFLPLKTERILLASNTDRARNQAKKLELAGQFFDRYRHMELAI